MSIPSHGIWKHVGNAEVRLYDTKIETKNTKTCVELGLTEKLQEVSFYFSSMVYFTSIHESTFIATHANFDVRSRKNIKLDAIYSTTPILYGSSHEAT